MSGGSRRLDISSLLCDDTPDDHVVLAPHLRSLEALVHAATQERRRLSGSDLIQPQPQQPHPHQPQQFSQHQHHQQQARQSPQFHRNSWKEEPSYPPRQPQSPLHPKSIDELTLHSPRETFKAPTSPYQQPQQSRLHSYDEDKHRFHQLRQQQLEQQERDHQYYRAQEIQRQHRLQQEEADRRRAQEAERLAELERKAQLERERMEEERQKLENERKRLLEVERRLQEQEQRRQEESRREAERLRLEEERREHERREREIAAIREAERREQQRREREEIQRREEQQRYFNAQEIQRSEDMQLRLHHHQHQRRLLSPHQQHHAHLSLQHHSMHQHQQPNQRQYEHPPRIEIPPGPQLTTSRKSDPIPILKSSQSQSPIIQPLSHIPPDQRPTKKRRYSESPSMAPMLVDESHDRIQREREKMSAGEIGYGRFESPIAGPSSSSVPTYTTIPSPMSVVLNPVAPRRPHSGSGSGGRKPVSVSDLLSPDHEDPISSVSSPSIPLGRRSPPGSQIGRAKASRKAEEYSQTPHPPPSRPSVPTSSPPSAHHPNPVIAIPEVHRPVSLQVPLSPQPLPTTAASVEDSRPSVPVKRHKGDKEESSEHALDGPVPAPRKKTPSTHGKEKEQFRPHKPPEKDEPKEHGTGTAQEGDAHDWLLQHYAHASPAKQGRDSPSHSSSNTSSRTARPRTQSPSSSTVPRRTKSPVVTVPFKKQAAQPPPPPSTVRDQDQADDDDDGGLDQELEELLAEVKVPNKPTPPDSMDVDVDSAVADLVAETLEERHAPQKEANRRPRTNLTKEEEEEEDGDIAMRPASTAPEAQTLVDDVEDELLSLVEDKPTHVSHVSATLLPKQHDVPVGSGKAAKAASKASRKPAKPSKTLPPPLKTSGISSEVHLASATATSASPTSASRDLPPLSDSAPPSAAAKDGSIKQKKVKDDDRGKDIDGDSPPSAPTTTAPVKKKNAKKSKAQTSVEEGTPSSSTSTVPKAKAKSSSKVKKASGDLDGNKTTNSIVHTPSDTGSKSTKSAAGAIFTKGGSVSRSRSTSVKPGIAVDEPQSPADSKLADEEESQDTTNEDDKLYCVCKTKYDQERAMIACDRCDDWYHMQCVNMPELVADLVDQFFCPPCIEKNPKLNLTTTYKARCLWGLKHPDPDSVAACHKPARGAFSKYCSEECGVKYMQSRIDSWAKKGGKKEKLWESVKHAEKREGVVVRIEATDECAKPANLVTPTDDEDSKNGVLCSSEKTSQLKAGKPVKTKVERDKERLNATLDHLAKVQDEIKKSLEILSWRERLLNLAVERSETVSQCGWDQRLCFGDDEWTEGLGQTIADSYESYDRSDRMDIDEAEGTPSVEGSWWCSQDSGCARHVGWQTTRFKDIAKEKEKREEAFAKFHGREQDVRAQLEELESPSVPNEKQRRPSNARGSGTGPPTHTSKTTHKPLTSINSRLPNGQSKGKGAASEPVKKGKKRKAP
ncbi:hypothetical protein CC1G_06739 [Coprinopsis cinerea okayama7|uniref:PHD-type domain-containing protein n=1 Tax=Coprinopsis cinerea (strain Okayama-7 / 130 / ATCC MYA-4618 / FGSC 9003) TaxID=240176 RepID=A8N1Q9_COPC7|nr:hypothetical protein CC1G_06739 [Coprinopsis cinerea okayama7\|eukprot:XP_001828753.2 hypothetical protein CC1G_06739 [Coprinopsis cinerea okayama7\